MAPGNLDVDAEVEVLMKQLRGTKVDEKKIEDTVDSIKEMLRGQDPEVVIRSLGKMLDIMDAEAKKEEDAAGGQCLELIKGMELEDKAIEDVKKELEGSQK